MGNIFATPKEGVLVRHENGKPLDPVGEPVERNSYWLRRERDGDVRLSDVPEDAPVNEVAAESVTETAATPIAAPAKKAKA